MAITTLITGVNRGIGLELARQSAARGDHVIGTARDPERAAEVAALARQHPGRTELFQADVTDPASLDTLATGAPVDLLICNAGQYLARGGIDDPAHTPDGWQSMMMTNVAGVFFTIRACLPRLKAAAQASGTARVAVISSMMGSTARAPGGSYIYRASKAAATNLAANLARDLAAEGIAVGAYHPGWVRTDMGGAGADIPVEESAAGLLTRFDKLSLGNAPVFVDYQGAAIAP